MGSACIGIGHARNYLRLIHCGNMRNRLGVNLRLNLRQGLNRQLLDNMRHRLRLELGLNLRRHSHKNRLHRNFRNRLKRRLINLRLNRRSLQYRSLGNCRRVRWGSRSLDYYLCRRLDVHGFQRLLPGFQAHQSDKNIGNISLYYGNDIKEEEASALANEIKQNYGNCDIDIYYGGQPLYYYIVSLE